MFALRKASAIRMFSLLFVLFTMMVFNGCGGSLGAKVDPIAPDFSLPDVNGQKVTLSQLRGKPTMVNFWASWCGPCRIEIPEIQDFEQKHGQEINVLAVNYGEPAETVRQFVESNRLTFRVLTDEGFTVARLYGVRGIPATFFLNKEGKLIDIHLGPMTKDQIEAYADKAAKSS